MSLHLILCSFFLMDGLFTQLTTQKDRGDMPPSYSVSLPGYLYILSHTSYLAHTPFSPSCTNGSVLKVLF